VSYITAPVFSPAGTVSMQLVISGIGRGLPPAEIDRYVERLCAAAALVTSETHGQRPPG
jgi:DNA-binding IclR family transcriptional regulator